MDSKSEVVDVAKRCTTIVRSFVRHRFEGNLKEATEELLRLKEDGERFAMMIDKFLFDQEVLESYFITKEADSKRNILENLHEYVKIKENQVSMYGVLERNVVLMKMYHIKMDIASDKLTRFQNDLKTQAKDLKVRTMPAAKKGNSANIDHPSNQNFITVDVLNEAVETNRKDFEEFGEKVSAVQLDIKKQTNRIQAIQDQLEALKMEKLAYHKKLTAIQDKVTFLEQAVDFWSLTSLITSDESKMNELSTILFRKATEKSRAVIFSGATKKLAHTFIEAWDSELIQAERGYSHILNFTFTCAKCGRLSDSNPRLSGSALTCALCHEYIQKSPIGQFKKV